jgi:predicted solute-binding protein
MRERITSLQVRVDSDDVVKSTKRLDKHTKAGQRAERSTDNLDRSARRLGIGMKFAAAGAAALGGALFAFREIVRVQRNFDILNASLVTATGSMDNAAEAMAALKDFAATTPYAVGQSVTAFTKLVNMGLDPSERAMRAYGDTAAAMGKDLDQMIEAVADAATGEFERLKEFGIKASKEGDKVTFAFRGIRQEVQFTGRDIEKYLIELGEKNFGGAMAQRMATLDGAISNLQDSYNSLVLTISKGSGIGSAIEDAVRVGIRALDELNAMMVSGEFEQYIHAYGDGWADMFKEVGLGIDYLNKLWADSNASNTADSETFFEYIAKGFSLLPNLAQLAAKGIGLGIGTVILYGKALMEGLYSVMKSGWRLIVNEASTAGQAIGKALLAPLTGENPLAIAEQFARDTSSNFRAHLGEMQAAYGKFVGDITTATTVWKDGAQELSDKFLEQGRSMERATSKAQELREEYERLREESGKATGDRLARFRTGGGDDSDEEKAEKATKALKGAGKSAVKEFKAAKAVVVATAEEMRLMAIQSYQSMFGDLAGMTAAFAGEQSEAYKVLFAASKAFAIAEAVIKIQQGVAGAASLPWPTNLAAMASVVAATASIVSTIQGTNLSYENGGIVPGGSYYGDRMTARVNSGEMVLTRAQQASLFNLANGSSQPRRGGVTVNVNNNAAVDVQVQEQDRGDGSVDIELVINQLDKRLADNLSRGKGLLTGQLDRRLKSRGSV